MKKYLFILAAVLLASCSPKIHEQIVAVHDTLYVAKTVHDSIHTRDSIYVHEYSRGDTVYLEKTKWLTKYVARNSHDTIYISHTDTLTQVREVEKKLNRFQRMTMTAGQMAYGAVLGFFIIMFIRLRKRL